MLLPEDVDVAVRSPEEWARLVAELLGEVARLRDENAALRDEIARLKGLQGRPKIKPSGMERASAARGSRPKRKTKGSKTSRRVVEEEQILAIAAPPGSRFKGYEDFVVQDLRLEARVIRYRRQRWLTPDGRTCFRSGRRRDAGGPAAGGGRRPFLAGTAPLRAPAASPGTGHGRADHGVPYRPGRGHLEASGGAAPDRQERRPDRRSQGGAARRPGDGMLDHGRRYGGAPSRQERRDDPDRERSLCLLCHQLLQEPAELPGDPACRSRRLCHQRSRARLHA